MPSTSALMRPGAVVWEAVGAVWEAVGAAGAAGVAVRNRVPRSPPLHRFAMASG